jgi:hypothetical protein
MSNGKNKQDSPSALVTGIVSFFAFLGLAIPALFVNWDKIFPTPPPPPTYNPTPTPTPTYNPAPAPDPQKQPEMHPAEILQPLNGASVDRSTKVEGTFENLTPGDSLWVFVYPVEQHIYYPSQVTYNPESKVWSVQLVVGADEKEESGDSFKIGIFTADSALSKDLKEWRENGTSQLPSGIEILSSITVRRK